MSHVGRVMDASHGMHAPMTPAQGKFLTSLLDQATARHAPAGETFRAATRQQWAEGNLSKRAASAWIDALKQWLDARHPAEATTVATRLGATRPATSPAPRPTRTLPTQPTSEREQAMVARLASTGPTPLRDSVDQAVASVRAKKGTTTALMAPGFSIRTALKTWEPGRAATREEVGF